MLTSMLDVLTHLVGALVDMCFRLVPSLPMALVLASSITALAMAPLTVRAVRLSRLHAKLQPRLREIQTEHAGDPAALRDATMAAFRQAGSSPFTPILLMLLQAPLPLLLLRVVRGLTHHDGGVLAPQHVGGAVARAVRSGGASIAGVDLTTSGLAALHGPPIAALVVGLFVGIVLLVSLGQQRVGRASRDDVSLPHPLLKHVSKIAPVMALAWGMALPLAFALSVTTMAAVRVGILWVAERKPPIG